MQYCTFVEVDELLVLLQLPRVEILLAFDHAPAFAQVVTDGHLLGARVRVRHRVARLAHSPRTLARGGRLLVNLRLAGAPVVGHLDDAGAHEPSRRPCHAVRITLRNDPKNEDYL